MNNEIFSGGLSNIESTRMHQKQLELRPYQEQNLDQKVHIHVDDYRQHPTQHEGQFG